MPGLPGAFLAIAITHSTDSRTRLKSTFLAVGEELLKSKHNLAAFSQHKMDFRRAMSTMKSAQSSPYREIKAMLVGTSK